MKTGPAAGAAAPAVDLLGPADVAKVLGVSEEDVMAVISSGELKAKKIGSSYRVTRAALDAYLRAVAPGPAPPPREPSRWFLRRGPASRVRGAGGARGFTPGAAAQSGGVRGRDFRRPEKARRARPAGRGRVEPIQADARGGPFCGHRITAYKPDADSAKVKELDLEQALRGAAQGRSGRENERRSVQCQSCKAVMDSIRPASARTASSADRRPSSTTARSTRPIRPQSLLPFKVSQNQVRDSIRRWYGSTVFPRAR